MSSRRSKWRISKSCAYISKATRQISSFPVPPFITCLDESSALYIDTNRTLQAAVMSNRLVTEDEEETDTGGNLIERTSNNDFPPWINLKFDPNGRVLQFRGNTIICRLSPESTIYQALLGLYDDLQKTGFASLYTLLPPSSWHVTIFEGVCDRIREPELWPRCLTLEEPLENCNSLIVQRLQAFDLRVSPPYRLAIRGLQPLTDGVALSVVPASSDEERRLRELRDHLSTSLEIRAPNHDHYSFHISISYMLRILNDEQHKQIMTFLQCYLPKLPQHFELGAPEFCTFNDMFTFHRQFFLGDRADGDTVHLPT